MQHLREAAAYLKANSQAFQPETGIILGTGLGALAREVDVELGLACVCGALPLGFEPVAWVVSTFATLVHARVTDVRQQPYAA